MEFINVQLCIIVCWQAFLLLIVKSKTLFQNVWFGHCNVLVLFYKTRIKKKLSTNRSNCFFHKSRLAYKAGPNEAGPETW